MPATKTLFLALAPIAAFLAPLATPNLIRNPGLEETTPGGQPVGWEPLTIGAPAHFAVDEVEKHSGERCLRIVAPEITRSYWRSEPIAVAPGEAIRIGAWVKCRNKSEKGTVIAIAETTDDQGGGQEVQKVGVATPNTDWQPIEGTVTIPAGATQLRLRLGFSYASGTCWWDDLTVQALTPLVARVDLPDDFWEPAEAIPVLLLNREQSRQTVRVSLRLGSATGSATVTLTGEPTQRVLVPIRAVARGRLPLALQLYEGTRETPVFQTERTVLVPPPLSLSVPIPTHWVLEDGPPRLQGEVNLAVLPAERAEGMLKVCLLDGTGVEKASWSVGPGQGTLTRRMAFTLQVRNLPEGEYRVVAQFQSKHGKQYRVEQPWAVIPRRRAQVTLSADGYPVWQGRAFFPMGIFNGGARMEEAAEAGFTVSHAYNAVRVVPGRPPDDERARGFLDRAWKAGTPVVMMVPMRLAEIGDWEGFRRRIRMFRNHPGLLCWDEEEGLARGDLRPETLVQIRRVLQEEDPHHPFLVGDSRDVIDRVTDRSNFFPIEQMDIGMWWWYPIPLVPKTGDALQGEEQARSLELTPPTFLTLRNTQKPIWVGVQAYKKPGPQARYPNALEYRAQAYLAIIHGAKGLMWYGGSVTGGLFLQPKEGHWEDLKALVRELKSLEAVLMAPSVEPPSFDPAQAPISVALKHTGNRRVLLAANRGADAVNVVFHLSEPVRGTVPVLNEDRRVPITGRDLRDDFEGYAVHVYELPSADEKEKRLAQTGNIWRKRVSN